MALFKAWIGSLKYRIGYNPLLVTRAVKEGLYQVAYRNGWDADAEAEFLLALRLFVCCKGAQKQELCIVSQQALPGVLKALFLLRRGDYAAVTVLEHKFRTPSGRQIRFAAHGVSAFQLVGVISTR